MLSPILTFCRYIFAAMGGDVVHIDLYSLPYPTFSVTLPVNTDRTLELVVGVSRWSDNLSLNSWYAWNPHT